MSTTLTIRNLDPKVKRELRLQAARNQRSMEAEAREILAAGLAEDPATLATRESAVEERRKRIQSVVGIWKDQTGGKTTDEIMRELRGDD